jgi:hypothetical protein
MKRQTLARLALALAAATTLTSCANVDPLAYRAERPVLDLREYFSGTIDGWGMIQDRSGRVKRLFT